MTATVQTMTKGKVWKRPKDGKEFVGCLVGGYKDTREKLKNELWTRYGIRVAVHFGLEKRNDLNLFIPSHVEVCVILHDDIEKMLGRVRKACESIKCDVIEVRRKGVNTEWDEKFADHLYANPPRWRDNLDVDKYLKSSADLEQERIEELKKIDDKPRLAYEDPALRKSHNPTLADIAIKPKDAEPLAKTVAQIVANAAAEPVKKGKHRFESHPSPPGFPLEVRKAREAKGWFQGDLAEVLGGKQSMVSAWERGAGVPSYEVWLKLLQIFPQMAEHEPAGIKGKQAYEAKHGVKMVPPPKPYTPPTAPKTAKEAFAPKPAPVEPEPKPEPVEASAAVLYSDGPPAVEVTSMPQPAPVVSPPVIPAAPPPAVSTEHQVVVKLRSGGTLTLSADVNLFKLKGEDRKFVFEIIDLLEGYEAKP
jgi:DNA-binding transcriptional regulator YiaG